MGSKIAPLGLILSAIEHGSIVESKRDFFGMELVTLHINQHTPLLPVLGGRIVHPTIVRGVERQMAAFQPYSDSRIVAVIMS